MEFRPIGFRWRISGITVSIKVCRPRSRARQWRNCEDYRATCANVSPSIRCRQAKLFPVQMALVHVANAIASLPFMEQGEQVNWSGVEEVAIATDGSDKSHSHVMLSAGNGTIAGSRNLLSRVLISRSAREDQKGLATASNTTPIRSNTGNSLYQR